jgi:hypothetical protein
MVMTCTATSASVFALFWDNIAAATARWNQSFASAGTEAWQINRITTLTRVSHTAHAATTDDVLGQVMSLAAPI